MWGMPDLDKLIAKKAKAFRDESSHLNRERLHMHEMLDMLSAFV